MSDLIPALAILGLFALGLIILKLTSSRAVETALRLRGPAREDSPGAADPPSAGGSGLPNSMADACNQIDELQRDCRRLKSELNQALAQRDIARRQRDEARATGRAGGW